MDPILVTGSTGKIGHAVVRDLRDHGHPVRALVHRADDRARALAELGADVVVADAFDYDAILAALQGVRRAFFLPAMDPYMIQSALVFGIPARTARIDALVVLTQWLASPSHPSLLTRQHWLADRFFELLPDIAHVTVNPGFFADNYLNYNLLVTAAQLGIYTNPYGDSRNAPPSNEDIARVCGAVLRDPFAHAGRVYRPTGPALIDTADVVDTIAHVLERPVRRINLPTTTFKKAMRSVGVPAATQVDLLTYVDEVVDGSFAIGAPTTHVADLTGRTAENFETIVRRYAAQPAVQRSLRNRLKAIGDFAKVVLTPPLDLARYQREQRHPMPASLHLNRLSPTWRREHEIMATTGRLVPAALLATLAR